MYGQESHPLSLVVPAYAGVILVEIADLEKIISGPRVCGGDPIS